MIHENHFLITSFADFLTCTSYGQYQHRPTYVNEVDDQFFRQEDVKAVIKGPRTSQAMPNPKKVKECGIELFFFFFFLNK